MRVGFGGPAYTIQIACVEIFRLTKAIKETTGEPLTPESLGSV